MQEFLHTPYSVDRRELMASVARLTLGVSLLGVPQMARGAAATGGRAKRVIYLFMNGAMSQLDTWDPKPESEQQGPTEVIATSVPGIRLSAHLPLAAANFEHLAVVRSLSTETGAHQPGQYRMRTGYDPLASIRHPSLGPWVERLVGRENRQLPGSVVIGDAGRHPGAGFLGAQLAPVPIGKAKSGLKNVQPPAYLEDQQFQRRMELAQIFDRPFQRKFGRHAEVHAYSQLYDEAVTLLKSSELQAFEIAKEPTEVRQRYGDHSLGQGCLLARRLIEHGVRFVEVAQGGWDDHRDLFEADQLPQRAAMLDQALHALISDLRERRLLDETLVVVATEFGRTPKINQNNGRDHHPGAFSCVLAGGGVQGGQVYGRTDERAGAVEEDDVSVGDFNATIAYALRIPWDQEITSPDGRPFTIADGGEPLVRLFG